MDINIKTYAAYTKNEMFRLNSSSGGIFSQLAEWVLNNHGIVYGVAMSFDCKAAEFIRVDKLNDLSRLQGSKYLQAKVGTKFQEVKDDIMQGKLVLFSGTGCQVNGLKTFLGKEYNNLFCVDVICHGVPTPKLWRKYVNYIEEIYNNKIINVNFRAKDYGWINYGVKITDESLNSMYFSKEKNSYLNMFLRDYCLRPSCYECVAKEYKKSDLTLGDFWGIDNIEKDINDGNGVSLVITRTENGKGIFESIFGNIIYKEVSYESAVKYNPSEFSSVQCPKDRERFFYDLNILDYKELQNIYATSNHDSFKRRIKKIIKKFFF